MRKEYDFSQGERRAVLKIPPGKTRITIRIDDDILQWFRAQVHAAGGGNYQTLINLALRKHVDRSSETLRDMLRSVVREELAKYSIKKGAGLTAASIRRSRRRPTSDSAI